MSLRLPIPLIVALLEIPAPAAVIQGRIVEDHTNRPLASAEVRVYLQSGPGRIADLETDGEGRFQPVSGSWDRRIVAEVSDRTGTCHP
jgi:hypothetical protein